MYSTGLQPTCGSFVVPSGVFFAFEVLMYKVKAGQNFLGQNFDNNGVTLTFTTPGAVNPAEDEFIEMELECVLLLWNNMFHSFIS
jgi:hypothetical protein